jgi:VWFA-related protein
MTMVPRAAVSFAVAAFSLITLGAQTAPPQPPPITQAQQRPVFRGGTHFVRVDAYPLKDGKIVEGLQAEDFEVLEDGKPQKIESFDFLKFDGFTPEALRKDPRTQREGFDMAADPRYRVFVVYVDLAASTSPGAVVPNEDLPRIRQPLVNFLDRIMGDRDLFGFLTSRNSVKDLVLAQKTTVTVAAALDLWRAKVIDRDESDEVLDGCRLQPDLIEGLKAIRRIDQSYETLDMLLMQLGSIRQERKSVVLVSNVLTRAKIPLKLMDAVGGKMPQPGITTGGRVGIGNREEPGAANDVGCTAEVHRLAGIDFDMRYRELLRKARRENVAFYPITPAGLQAPATQAAMDYVRQTTDDLILLANETEGVAIVNTNDLNAGFRRIADDLAAYYVLGYYTTNTRFDGGLRNIKVQLKADGKTIRARRQYRAPTEAEIAALASGAGTPSPTAPGTPPAPSAYEKALVALERASRPFAVYTASAGKQLTVVTELSAASILAGKWKDGADVEIVATGAGGESVGTARGRIEPGASSTSTTVPATTAPPARVTVRLKGAAEPAASDWIVTEPATATLIGDAVAFRTGPRAPTRPVATFEFARNERVRAEWPVLTPLDRREVRLLDRTGKALPVDLPLAENPATKAVVVEMSLSGLGRGDYLIELTAGAGGITEKRLVAIRIK